MKSGGGSLGWSHAVSGRCMGIFCISRFFFLGFFFNGLVFCFVWGWVFFFSVVNLCLQNTKVLVFFVESPASN